MWEQFKRIHAAPAESEWKSVIVGMTEPISDQLTTEPGHGRLGLRGEEIYRETEIR